MNPGDTQPMEPDYNVPAVIGVDGQERSPAGLRLALKKFKRPSGNYYRLIWIDRREDQAWPCQEDRTKYRTKAKAVGAGEQLAMRLGVKFEYPAEYR